MGDRVLCAAPSARHDLIGCLLADPGVDLVIENDPARVCDRALRLRTDVVLVDAGRPHVRDDVEGLRAALPSVRVIAIGDPPSPAALVGLIQAGVSGLLPVEASAKEVHTVLDRVRSGHIAIPPSLRADLVAEVVRMDTEFESRQLRLRVALEGMGASGMGLTDTYRSAVEALASAIELRDGYTGGHIVRVRDYALAIAGRVDQQLTREEHVFGYMLHDIGKLAIPDSVLLKAGPLTRDEYELVKTHTTEGARFVEHIPFLRPSVALVRSHHERWDGTGYPDELAGHDIPIIARVFAVADALDAMTTDRPYRAAQPLAHAIDEITAMSGSQFDPDIVSVFQEALTSDDAFEALRAGVVPGRQLGMTPTPAPAGQPAAILYQRTG